MMPFADFTWFILALYPVGSTLLAGSFMGLGRKWILFWTVAVLCVQFSGSLAVRPGFYFPLLLIVCGYAIYQCLVAFAFLRARLRRKDRWLFYLALSLALLPLAAAKFVPLLAKGSQFGFLGISYVTFRALDVIFCIYDGVITSLPAAQLFAFLFFFPTISSGPIDRYRRFGADWNRERTRGEFFLDLDRAVYRLFTGLFYKFILSALIRTYWLDPASGTRGFLAAVSYMYAYSFYLFFDFAGYCLLAIGLGDLFGVHTPDNFDRPFIARNIRDFWNRWNITLSFWFRDHVYMRFLLAATKGRWFKNKQLASGVGFFLSFGLMGLWHGTEFHYILYGLYHACLFVAYDGFLLWNKQRKLWRDGPVWRFAGIVLTFHAVAFGFLIFSGHIGRVEEQPPPTVPPMLTADPNPLPPGDGAGSTTISWNVGDGSIGQVFLVHEDRPELQFGQGASGSKVANWIRSNRTYQFCLYGGRFGNVLKTLTVTRPGLAQIYADPNPVPSGPGMGETTLHWKTSDGSWAQVYLSLNGGPEKLIGGGRDASKDAPWIHSGFTYDFRLYAGTLHAQQLASVTVTRPAIAQLTATPNPVHCGAGMGTTTVTWDTGDGLPAELYIMPEGNPEILVTRGAKGSVEIPWIAKGKSYEFRLYSGFEHKIILSRVPVTGTK